MQGPKFKPRQKKTGAIFFSCQQVNFRWINKRRKHHFLSIGWMIPGKNCVFFTVWKFIYFKTKCGYQNPMLFSSTKKNPMLLIIRDKHFKK